MNTCGKSVTLLWLATLPFWLIACAEHKPVPPPAVDMNQEPERRFEIVVGLDQNPDDIEKATARVSYRITNTDCIPIDYGRSLGGSRPIIREVRSLSVERHGNEYSTAPYADLLKNEDYYGLGVCHWAIEGVALRLHRGSITNVVSTSLLHKKPPFLIERVRCVYKYPITNGRDYCLSLSAPLYDDTREFFTAKIEIRSPQK